MNLFIISYLSKERLIQHIYTKCKVFAGFLLTVVKSKVCCCNHLKISRSVTLRIDTMGNHHRCRYPASSSSQTETWCLLNSKSSSLQSLTAITLLCRSGSDQVSHMSGVMYSLLSLASFTLHNALGFSSIVLIIPFSVPRFVIHLSMNTWVTLHFGFLYDATMNTDA